MKVVQIAKYYPPAIGGIENNVEQLALASAVAGMEAVVVASNHKSSMRKAVDARGKVRVVRLPTMGRAFSLPLTFGWLRALRREADADVWHLHSPNPLAELACYLVGSRQRLIVTDHGDVSPDRPGARFRRRVYQALLQRSGAIVTYSRSYAMQKPDVAAHAPKLRVIPHGFDPLEFARTPAVDAEVARIREGMPGPIVLFVGRLVAYKGLAVLLGAFEALDAPAHLTIIGEGPELEELKIRASASAKPDRIHFLGALPRAALVPYYHAAAVLVLPSLTSQESFGQVLVEAALCGTPAIATRIGTGVEEIVKDGETGLLVAPGDAQELARALGLLLADDEERRSLGRRARAHGEKHYSAASVEEKVVALYHEGASV